MSHQFKLVKSMNVKVYVCAIKFLALQARAIAAYLPPENSKHRGRWVDSYRLKYTRTQLRHAHIAPSFSKPFRRHGQASECTQRTYTARTPDLSRARNPPRLQVAKDAYPYAHSNVRRVGCGRVRGERSIPCIACEDGHGLY